jgi:hypothetical protein
MSTEQHTPPPLNSPPVTQPPKPKRKLGCFAWLGIIIGGLILLGIIGNLLPSNTPSQSGDTGTNTVFEAGAWVGAVDGMADYNRGSTHATDEELDAAGRRGTANMKFDKPEDRQNWIDGYKAGYDIGWNKEAKGQ